MKKPDNNLTEGDLLPGNLLMHWDMQRYVQSDWTDNRSWLPCLIVARLDDDVFIHNQTKYDCWNLMVIWLDDEEFYVEEVSIRKTAQYGRWKRVY